MSHLMMTGVRTPMHAARSARNVALLVCLAAVCTNYSVRGGETNESKSTASAATTEEETDYKNWIELGIGGLIVNGDAAQFKQEHRISGNVFGGIQDLHYERTLGKDVALAVDGHAIFDNHDYDVQINLSKPKLGYIRAGYTEFRSWYDGNGGFFPINGQFFNPPFPETHIDRGEAWIELGLRVPNWPEITVRYSHLFREGQKDSTSWGDTALTGLPDSPRKIAPAFRGIDETRDIFALDLTKNFGKTDVALGMRYEHSTVDNSLNLWRGAGEVPPVVAAPGAQRFVTQHDSNKLDLFSGHGIVETHFSDWLWFTAGYSYTTLGSDIAGSRIYGTRYDAGFDEPVPTLQVFDAGFLNLAGTSDVNTHVVNANLLWTPCKDLTVLTGFRYTRDDKHSNAVFLSTEVTAPGVTPDPEPSQAETWATFDRFGERLELRYTGFVHWFFYAQGEWEQEYGRIHERETGALEEAPVNKDTSFHEQKYTVGANWYPLAILNLSAQYYHKIVEHDNDILSGAHQRLLGQDWNTDDFNVRMTWRPPIPAKLGTLSLVSRYDFARTTIDGQWFFEGTTLDKIQSGEITKHVVTESITWNPLARLYLQGDLSYVWNQTETPASKINLDPFTSPSVLDFSSDYWTVGAGAGYVIDDKTDVRADYLYYRADNYVNNATVGMPYGMGATEHTVSVTATRQITKNMRLLLKYSYFDYTNQTSGGHNNYTAHSIYSGLQFRF